MGALRTRMIEEMKLRNFSPRTQQSYLAAMIGLVKHHRQSPDQLTQEEIRAYLGGCPSNTEMAVFRGGKTPPGSPIVDPGAFYEVVF